jgi:hypothetical protein
MPEELLPHWLRVRKFPPSQRQRAGKLPRDLGRDRRDQGGQPTTRVPEIGSSEYDAGAHDTDADLGAPDDGEQKGVAIYTPGGPELAGRDDCCRDPGELRHKSQKITEYCSDEGAHRAPQG